jgi:hypothetical protein
MKYCVLDSNRTLSGFGGAITLAEKAPITFLSLSFSEITKAGRSYAYLIIAT